MPHEFLVTFGLIGNGACNIGQSPRIARAIALAKASGKQLIDDADYLARIDDMLIECKRDIRKRNCAAVTIERGLPWASIRKVARGSFNRY